MMSGENPSKWGGKPESPHPADSGQDIGNEPHDPSGEAQAAPAEYPTNVSWSFDFSDFLTDQGVQDGFIEEFESALQDAGTAQAAVDKAVSHMRREVGFMRTGGASVQDVVNTAQQYIGLEPENLES